MQHSANQHYIHKKINIRKYFIACLDFQCAKYGFGKIVIFKTASDSWETFFLSYVLFLLVIIE